MLPTLGGNFNSPSLDSTRDILYVGDAPKGVRVYDNATTANQPGGVPPSRTISGNFGESFSIRDIAVDPIKDILYVAVTTLSSMSIFVFESASTASILPPNRTISVTPSTFGTMGLFLDAAHDRLYFADSDSNVFILENASTKLDRWCLTGH